MSLYSLQLFFSKLWLVINLIREISMRLQIISYSYILMLGLIICIGTSRYAYSTDISTTSIEFNHVTIKDGLANNRVDCMLQDYEGYLWFGTKRGLCRFNGYEFKTYKSQPGDATSLRYHQISSLWEDSNNILWIGTMGGGLNYYNRKEDNFSQVDILPASFSKLNPENIIKITPFSENEIWVIHTEGLTRIDKNSKKIISFKNILSLEELPGQISSVFTDQSGICIIAIQNSQLL